MEEKATEFSQTIQGLLIEQGVSQEEVKKAIGDDPLRAVVFESFSEAIQEGLADATSDLRLRHFGPPESLIEKNLRVAGLSQDEDTVQEVFDKMLAFYNKQDDFPTLTGYLKGRQKLRF